MVGLGSADKTLLARTGIEYEPNRRSEISSATAREKLCSLVNLEGRSGIVAERNDCGHRSSVTHDHSAFGSTGSCDVASGGDVVVTSQGVPRPAGRDKSRDEISAVCGAIQVGAGRGS